MNVIAIVFAAILLVVPIALIINLWRQRPASKVAWLISAVISATFVGYSLLVGRWDLFSYYLRPLLVLALLAAVVISLVRVWSAPWWASPGSVGGWLNFGLGVLVAMLFIGFFGLAASGLSAGSVQHVRLSDPLRGGVYYVGQGGANTFLNYHHANRAQAYAVDVVALNAAGLHAWGLAPADHGRYAVFGRDVHSPCDGMVIEARDGLADLNPPATDRENLAGNHVVLRCTGTEPAVDVELAHMRQGSVAVVTGARVREDEVLGKVGNTGNTSEPHLHVHAVRTGSGTTHDGEGVPIRFDGRFLVRNSLIFGN
jgi:hypothetical protein